MHSTINSIGIPPDRYADRVVSEMLRALAQQRAKNTHAIMELAFRSNDGNPRAQSKLANKIIQAGAIHVALSPGKRGKYRIVFYDLVGWDIGRNEEVSPGDPVPDEANCWLVAYANALTSYGGGRNTKDLNSAKVMFVSKHCLVRAVQRFGARTPADLMAASYGILDVVLTLAREIGATELRAKEHRIKLTGGPTRDATLILKPDEKHKTVIAATIF